MQADKPGQSQSVPPPAIGRESYQDGNGFFPHTAASTDGVLLRDFALLGDEALHTVALMFSCMETLETLPQQRRYVLVVLISKATSGMRSVCVFCALFRLWARCRTETNQLWEDLHPRLNFTASKGAQHEAFVPVWRDFAQFYERIHHRVLWLYGRCSKFPLPLWRVAISTHRSAMCVGAPW